MSKRYVFNDGNQPKMVGGVLLHPQEGREVDEEFLPPEEVQAGGSDAADAPSGDGGGSGDGEAGLPLADLAAMPLKDLLPLLEAQSDERLADLQALENQSEHPRKGLLGAIGELQLKRAGDRLGAGKA